MLNRAQVTAVRLTYLGKSLVSLAHFSSFFEANSSENLLPNLNGVNDFSQKNSKNNKTC